MRILISNDDGIQSPGLRTLAETLAREQDHEIYVVAPDRERTAAGLSVTLHKPLRVEEVEIPGALKSWSTTGTPNDCVKLAIMELLPCQPDIVISGINSDPNLGSDILVSGTVAAALSAWFSGIFSIAVSIAGAGPPCYSSAAVAIGGLLKILPFAGLGKRTLLNVNVPNLPLQKIAGITITEPILRFWEDRFEKRSDPRGKKYYWRAGEAIEENQIEGTDVWAISHKRISISPICFNMTDTSSLLTLRSLSLVETILASTPSTSVGVSRAKKAKKIEKQQNRS